MDAEAPSTKETPVEIPLPLGGQLLIEFESLKMKVKCTLVGMERGRYLILKIPAHELMGSFQSEAVRSAAMMVRYLTGQTLHSFSAEILNTVPVPAKLFFVAWPKSIDSVSMKDKGRYECSLQAGTMVGNEILDITIRDVSREGCLAVIKLAGKRTETLASLIQVNKLLHLQTRFPDSEARYTLTGRIRNIGKESDKLTIGLQFEDLQAEVRTKLDGFIASVVAPGGQ